MIEYFTPNAAEFQAGAREHFDYLTSVYGYQVSEAPSSLSGPYTTSFTRSGTFVCVQGLSYGMSLAVELGTLGALGTVENRFSLHTLMHLRKSDLLVPRFGEKRGQLEEMKFSALALRQTARDFLTGNFAALQGVLLHESALRTKDREKYENAELSRATTSASSAFHTGQFARVVELLQPRMHALSKAHAAMLRLAKKRLSDRA